jgi:penicillin-binding protein 2
MSFHPNEVQRRGQAAGLVIAGALGLLAVAFFRTQVIDHERYALRSEENRLEQVPLPAPRGVIRDRVGRIIADNIPGYSVSILARGEDSLRAELRRLARLIEFTDDDIEVVVRRYKRERTRPAVIFADATFDQVSILEEHRTSFPSLIIQAAPKRHYPDGPAVSAFVGFTNEIGEQELNSSAFRDKDYRPGQQIGKAGLERQYEARLRGKEGSRFVEVDALGRVVREMGARPDLAPVAGPELRTGLDLDLQRFVAAIMDTLQGGAVAMDPTTGAVLALHSAPAYDPNRFIGGISSDYWQQLMADPRKPLYNKALQGWYPPASTFKLVTAALAMEQGIISLDDRMPVRCTGSYQYGTRPFRCWEKKGHGSLTLAEAIAKSCDVYFYQLGLRLGLEKFVQGGLSLKLRETTGIDLPDEKRPEWPFDASEYYDRKYGPRGWTQAVALNLAIGQGENAQTVLSMARLYTALASDGWMATPWIVTDSVRRTKVFHLTPEQFAGLRAALVDVVSTRGTAASAAIQGVQVAGKTGTAQNAGPDHAWFVGFAPADQPAIVVAVMIEHGLHGYAAARIATKIIEHYLKRPAIEPTNVRG